MANQEKQHSARGSTGRTPGSGEVKVVFPEGLLYQELRKAIFLIAALFLAYRMAGPISAILLFFLLVFILAAVLNPIVVKLHSWGVPRMAAAPALVFTLLACVVVVGWLALPPLFKELGGFAKQFDAKQYALAGHYDTFRDWLPDAIAEQLPLPAEIVSTFKPDLSTMVGHLGLYTMNLLVGLVSIVLFLVLVIYTLGRPEPLVAGFLAAVPDEHRDRADTTIRRIMEKLKRWVLSAAIVGVIVGTVTGLGLYFLGVPSALVFALLAAFGELLPNLGPILASIPPILLALTIDPMLALWVALLFLGIQQLENNILSPMIHGENLELHPVSLLFTVIVMHSQFGLLGAFLAVPVCSIIKVCWEEFYLKPRGTNGKAVKDEAGSIIESSKSEDKGPLDDSVTGSPEGNDNPEA